MLLSTPPLQVAYPPTNLPHSTPNTNAKMSAPNAGRQSPEPETQSEAQVGATTEDVKDQGQAPSGTHEAEGGADQLKGLESNPKGPLEDAAAEKTEKHMDPKA